MPVRLMALAALMLIQEGIHGKGINPVVGLYLAYGERFYMCDNGSLPWKWHVRATHFNPYKPKELQRITGNVTAHTAPLDDNCWGKVVVDARSNNQWKENAYVFNFKRNGCRVLKENAPGFYAALFKNSELKGPCVIKQGVYEFNDVPVEWSFPNVPILPYGHYRFRVMVGRAENQYACWVADARTIPKPE
ncbi:uncharacterized protein LOC113208786 [Frankliniella occidentalis]|uniref:Uncharacterized protein LOC113208786 n=1 Tax=Frankliniella occidentalis TaxID=133901 RepID=A0A6J1STB4_FRAOC|nr:uncharacterized protein LOC113208786 [Frankliniella occidentalis]